MQYSPFSLQAKRNSVLPKSLWGFCFSEKTFKDFGILMGIRFSIIMPPLRGLGTGYRVLRFNPIFVFYLPDCYNTVVVFGLRGSTLLGCFYHFRAAGGPFDSAW